MGLSKKVAIVGCPEGDWEALYVDGKKVDEGHTLQLRAVFNRLEIEVEFLELAVADDEAAFFPDDLAAASIQT